MGPHPHPSKPHAIHGRPRPSLPTRLAGASIALVMGVSLLGSGPLPAQDDDPAAALAQLQWRSIGPANMGGRVTDVLGVPGVPKTFWVAGADGGLWKTTNGGTTFVGQFEDEDVYSVGAVGMAPSDPNVLYLGSGEGDPRNSVSYGLGVYRSTDGGDSWTHVGLEDTERIKRVRVHPDDPDTAWVCALGHEWGANEERGVFRTTNGGDSWDRVLYIDEDTGCSDLDIDLSNPRILYAGMWTHRRLPWRFDEGGKETAVYRTKDGGDTWEKLSVVGEPMARIGVAVAQSQPRTVYVITETPTMGTLFRSDDHGESWRMVNDERNINFRPFYYADMRVDPNNAEVLYALSGGLFKSTDGGRSFDRIGNGVHGDHQAFWIDPEDSDRLISGSDGGWQLSFDAGATFDVQKNIVLSQFYQIFVDDRDPYYVCGGLQDNGNWCGPSNSAEGGIHDDHWYTVSGGDGFYTVPVPGKPHLVYSNAQGGYLRITDTRSGLTRSIEPYPRMMGSQGQSMLQARYRFNWDAPIHISPHDPDTVYWGGNVLFRSRDEGYSWEIISPDLTTNDPEKQRDSGGEIYNDNTAAEFHTTILTVRESPVEAGVIWVGTDDGNVQVTRDDGESWTNVKDKIPGLPAETWIAKIDASHHVPGRAYIAVDNHRLDDFTPHAYRCDDYGNDCVDLSAGLPQDDYAKVIREDPTNESVLYVGMERSIQVSWDGGESFSSLRLNLPPVSVRDIKVHPRDNDLVIGTHGRGAWILDDIAPIQQLAEARSNELYVFPARRATRWESWNPDASQGQRFFRGENPRPGAYVNFYLAVVPDGPVRVRITDSAGNEVRSVDVREPVAGVNRAYWNLDHEGATPRRNQQGGGGGFFRFFGSFGPPAVPDTYTATVMVGEMEDSTTIELRGDPRIDMAVADYQAQHEAAVQVRDLVSTVNGLMDTAADLTEQLQALDGRISRAELDNVEMVAEQIGTALQQLEELDDKVQRPFPRMGYRQYPRLSEELRRLQGAIAGTQARPTEGQMEVLTELTAETAERTEELDTIIDTTIEELNRMLGNAPKILIGNATGSGSEGEGAEDPRQ